MRAPYTDSDYFRSSGKCYERLEYECDECQQAALEAEEEKKESMSITSIALRQDTSRSAEESKDNFSKQVEFVKVGLDLDDEKVNKIKVKDLGKYVTKTQQEITVGKMKDWLGIDKKKKLGVIGTILRFIKWRVIG